MTWTVIGSEGVWAQWVDLDKATAWRAELLACVAAPPPDAATLENWPLQVAAVKRGYTAVCGLALACDMPIPSLAPWARALVARDAGEALGGSWYAEASARQYDVGADELSVLAVCQRITTTVDATVRDARINDSAPPVDAIRCNDDVHNDCDVSDRGVHHGATGWTCASWQVCRPGAGPGGTEIAFLVPLRWHWELLVACAGEVSATSDVRQMVSTCRAWIVQRNAATVRALQAEFPDVEVPEDVPMALAQVAATRYDVDPGIKVASAIGASLAALGPVGLAFAGIAALPALLLRLFGRAVASQVDVWDRRLPVLESAHISGSFAPVRAPTHAVPTPPELPGVTLVLSPSLFPAALDYAVRYGSGAPETATETYDQSAGEQTGDSDWIVPAMIAGLILASR